MNLLVILYSYILIHEIGLSWWFGGKEFACNVGVAGWIPESRRFPWRRAWEPTPVFLPAESHGQRSLTGYSPWGHKESDATEETENACMYEYVRFEKSLCLDFCLNFRNWPEEFGCIALPCLKKIKEKNSSNCPVYTFLCIMCVNSCSVLFLPIIYISNYRENTETGIWEPFLQHKEVALCFLTCLLNDLVFSEEQKPFTNTEEI